MLQPKETYWRNVGVGSVIVPSEGTTHAPTEDERWGWMLVDMAVGNAAEGCPANEPGCEVCVLSRWWWERKYAELPRYIRMAVCRTLIRHDIPLMIEPTVIEEV